MTSPTRFMLTPFLALALLCGCALTKDRYRGVPLQGQTEEQRLADEEECHSIALANKGSADSAAAARVAMGAGVGAVSGAVIGASVGSALANAGGRAVAGAGAGAAAGLLVAGILEVERRGTQIYTACMSARGYTVGQ